MEYKKKNRIKKDAIIAQELEDFKEGKLHSGSKKGPIVKKKKQAIAIALNVARKKGARIRGNKK